ncbi:MAG: NIPSNAP family protein [Verrucomicrobia bacterium]|nr:NIPSNAP family protein [Verrucomicrobiota bacterium]
MNRRAFLTSTVTAGAAGLAAALPGHAAQPAAPGQREYYELRRYQLRRGAKQKLFDDYVSQAAIPAMNRAGVKPIGVFNVMLGPDSPSVYVLIRYESLEQFATASDRMRSDEEYRRLAAPYTDLPATDPGYIRVESSLMVAFEGMPKLEVPSGVAEKKPRIFELRIYESHSKKANKKKIEMFNIGEIAIFRRTGLTPVFFGETLIGTRLPNLTYLLVFDDLAARDKAWSTFVADPEWKTLSTTPGYTDPEIVSNISNVLLRPTSYSQI